ncbi:hypothetical protein NEOLEDRAFT_58413 [Neolentinus lepideus HHB14362 ss-1]|uniref:C2H2-type domain-containing protein n=1 Tax=Neolentinus lepideus HHB14362 ss-1 TaxID=1314782 RepID=A0A165U7B3_9AGAM|nr:hypothetical protein NEOLEDRAFT_58413 [Neolentinus lepideus HHB14362 ss-1]
MALAHLTIELFVDLAKNCRKAFPCEWEWCDAKLNSFHTYTEHISMHYDHAAEVGNYQCKFISCSDQSHATQANLHNHITKAHLAFYLLPCPIEGCNIKNLKQHYLTWLPYRPRLPALPLRVIPTITQRSLDRSINTYSARSNADSIPFDDLPILEIPTVDEDPLFEFTDFDIVPRQEEGTQLAKPPCVSAKIDREDPTMSISYKVWKYRQNEAAGAGTLDGDDTETRG